MILIVANWDTKIPEYFWASSWDYDTYLSYHIGNQRRLRRACSASAQSHQSLRCSHTWSMEVDEGSDQNSSSTGWLHMSIWRMSLRRMESTIITWPGSFNTYWWNSLQKIFSQKCWQSTLKIRKLQALEKIAVIVWIFRTIWASF